MALICPEATVLTFDTGDYYVKNNIVDNYSDYASKVQEYLRGMKNIQFRLAHSTLDDWHLIVPKIFKKFQVEVINLDSEWLNKEITKKELEICIYEFACQMVKLKSRRLCATALRKLVNLF